MRLGLQPRHILWGLDYSLGISYGAWITMTTMVIVFKVNIRKVG